MKQLAVFFALPVFACVSEPTSLVRGAASQDAIIEGEACADGAFPNALAILIDADISMEGFGEQTIKSVVCGGTLIAPDVVMTAAHCVDAKALTFGFGEVDRQEYFVTQESELGELAQQETSDFPDDAVEAVGWVAHPDFSLESMNEVDGPGEFSDIALIFLSQPLDITPEALITEDEAAQLVAGAEVDIVGWGQQTETGFLEAPPPGTVGEKQCAVTTINEVGTHEMQIGDRDQRKCHGDSGGPSYMFVDTGFENKRRVVGVTSHAYDMEDCQKGGVDTRVDKYRDWLEAEMTAACDDDRRSWCDVPGLLSPDDLPAVIGDGGDDEPGDDPESTERRGSSKDDCAAAGGSPLLGLLLLRLRRRR